MNSNVDYTLEIVRRILFKNLRRKFLLMQQDLNKLKDDYANEH